MYLDVCMRSGRLHGPRWSIPGCTALIAMHPHAHVTPYQRGKAQRAAVGFYQCRQPVLPYLAEIQYVVRGAKEYAAGKAWGGGGWVQGVSLGDK